LKGDYTLVTFKNTDRTVVTRVFSPEQRILFDHPQLTIKSAWELFTVSDQIEVNSTTPEAPRSVHINIDSIRKSDFPHQWPKPIVSHSNSIYSREQFSLAHIDTTSNISFIKIDSVLVLIIKNDAIIDEKTISALFERIDLIIICTDSAPYAESIRQQFRPRLCVATSTPPVNHAPQTNMIFTSKNVCSVECSVSGKKSIKIAKIR
jgi:hypothetical protein